MMSELYEHYSVVSTNNCRWKYYLAKSVTTSTTYHDLIRHNRFSRFHLSYKTSFVINLHLTFLISIKTSYVTGE
jgi:hypothetical protein